MKDQELLEQATAYERMLRRSAKALDQMPFDHAANVVESLSSRLRQLQAENAQEWQPIDTAPNGESILVHYEDKKIVMIKADDNEFDWEPYQSGRFGVAPTHWLPLPTPPAQGGT